MKFITNLIILAIYCFVSAFMTLSAQQSTMDQTNGAIQTACDATSGGNYVTVGNAGGSLQVLHFNVDKRLYQNANYNLTGRNMISKDIRQASDLLVGSILRTDGYWVTGNHTIGSGSSGLKMFVMRIDANGNVRWFKETAPAFPGSSGAKAIIPVGTNAVFLGSTSTGIPTLTCFSNLGTVLWGPIEVNHPRFTIQAEAAEYDAVNNQIVVTGSSKSATESGRATVFAVNASTGQTRWFGRYLFGTSSALSSGMDIAINGGDIAITGYISVGTSSDVLFLRVRALTGQMVPYGLAIRETATSWEQGNSICAAQDGGWAIAGSCNANQSFFARISSGAVAAARRYPLTSYLKESIDIDLDGNYFMATHNSIYKYHDLWLGQNGQTACVRSETLPLQAFRLPYVTLHNDFSMSVVSGTSWAVNYPLIASSIITQQDRSVMLEGTLGSTANSICACSPSPAVFMCGSARLGQAPYSYQWNNGVTSPCQSVAPAVSTGYYITIRDATGCSTSLANYVSVVNSNTLPSGVEVAKISGSTALVFMQDESCYSSYSVTYRATAPGAPWSVQTSASLPVMLTGLTCNTKYEAYMTAEICGVSTPTAGIIFGTAACGVEEGVGDRSSVSETAGNAPVKAFPNPTNGMVTLDAEKFGPLRDIRLLSPDGKVMEVISAPGIKYELDLSSRPSGIYFVQCNPENGVPQMLRIVKE